VDICLYGKDSLTKFLD
jgi:protein phosphatase